MPRRSRAREVVLQVLYQDDLNPGRSVAPDQAFIRGRLRNNRELTGKSVAVLRCAEY